jgi:hypothetical protein
MADKVEAVLERMTDEL